MVIKNILCLSLIFVFLVQNSTQTIYITQPAVTPFVKNQIPYWYANFGVIHYNKPMAYDIYVTDSTLCGDEQEAKIEHFKKPTFIVVNDGGYCSYPNKALKAEELGAQGILFGSFQTDYAVEGVVLADDGNGRKIKIPSLFITPTDMNSLKQLKNPKIKVNFPIKKSSKSSVTLFLNAGNRHNYIYLRDFKEYFMKVKDNIRLSVVYHTIQCEFCDKSECILQNKCCSYDSENYESGYGRYIVEQQFRQYKIFLLFEKDDSLQKWFEYMDLFDKNCNNDWINSASCSKNILQQLGFNGKLKLLDEFDTMMAWRREQTKTGVFSYPDISVNGVRHMEILTAATSFNMICESLSSPPETCSKEIDTPEGNKAGFIIGVILVSIILIFLGLICYRKVFKREITNDMSSRVNELVAKYASKVSEQKKKRKDKLMEKMTEEL